jgi:uncharacterized protein (TIGR02646 family)
MRNIKKLRETAALRTLRATPGATFDDLKGKAKQKVRENLVKEQRGLCAFCGARIIDGALDMKIAHFYPQTAPGGAARSLEYMNMLGACLGGEGRQDHEQHCDTHQKNKTLAKNPANPADNIENLIVFDFLTGEIRSTDAKLNKNLGSYDSKTKSYKQGVLNLNISWMRSNRHAVIKGFQAALGKQGLTKLQVKKHLSNWNGSQPGSLNQYAPVVAYWLRKRLAQF